ncbi:hypothetical protein EV368DRAFT_78402 [Lentinula lateritia]|nr:hypothetical protein EV368DRAFT_78402 [Lentinula lateritia]
MANKVAETIQAAPLNVARFPDKHIPWPTQDEILRQIGKTLERAKKQLEHVIRDESSQVEKIIRVIHDFVSIQVRLLPGDVRKGIDKFNEFRHEHPSLCYCCCHRRSGGSRNGVYGPLAFPRSASPFRICDVWSGCCYVQISPLHSYADLSQGLGLLPYSLFSTEHVRAASSRSYNVTMSAKSYWPVAGFLDLAAVSVGTIAVWASEMVIPDLNLVVKDDEIAGILFDDFLKEVGRRCEEADIPKVQWLDVAIETVAKAVQEIVQTGAV